MSRKRDALFSFAIFKMCSSLLVIALAACSGGSSVNSAGSIPAPPSGDTPTPAPPPGPRAVYSDPVPPPTAYVITPQAQQPMRSANDTDEFRADYSANEFVHALYALDHGYTGGGVTVGVIDDGAIDVKGELDGRIDTSLSRDFGYITSGGVRTKRNALGDENSDHGTAVANILAANPNGVGAVGYASGAKLAILRISDWNADSATETLVHAVDALDYATSKGIKLVNVSLSTGASATYRDALTRYGETGGLAVLAAGNYGEPDPRDAGAITDANRDAVLFVVALSPNVNAYTLEPYSSQAGSAMDHAVAAVGSNVTTLVDGSVGVFVGTSSATPTVSALAATILSKWPQLTGQQAGEVILETAKDIGDPGVDPVFGHGLVDFQAALAPVNPTLSNGSAPTSLQASVMGVPEEMNAGSIQAALSHVTVLDAYGRDFSGSVANLVIKPEAHPSAWMERRVAQLATGGSLAVAQGPASGRLGFASFQVTADGAARTVATDGKVSFAIGTGVIKAGWNSQPSLQSDIVGLAPVSSGVRAYAPQAGDSLGYERSIAGGRLALTLSAGSAYGTWAHATSLAWSDRKTDVRLSLVDENGSVMGIPTGEGGLRLGRGAATALIEVHRRSGAAAGWNLEAYGSLGLTRLKIDNASLVTGSSAIISSRLGLQASGPGFGGVLSFGLAQPLTIESGAVDITYGSGYDLDTRSLTYATTRAGLAGRRRVQLTGGYATSGTRSSFRLGILQDVTDGLREALIGWWLRY